MCTCVPYGTLFAREQQKQQQQLICFFVSNISIVFDLSLTGGQKIAAAF